MGAGGRRCGVSAGGGRGTGRRLAGLSALAFSTADGCRVPGSWSWPGIVLTLVAQLGLGASWRIRGRHTETTELVTTGPFALVRNPIFTALLATLIGLALMVGNLVAIAGLVIAVVGIEVQVRGVEEPYLRRVHGRACPTTPLRWAASCRGSAASAIIR